MGVMDAFTPDATVELKHGEYSELMREAAKAELIGNAVKADVPSFYINAMLTGKKPTFDDVEPAIDLEEMEQEPWGMLTTAARRIFAEKNKANEIDCADERMIEVIEAMRINRHNEIDIKFIDEVVKNRESKEE